MRQYRFILWTFCCIFLTLWAKRVNKYFRQYVFVMKIHFNKVNSVKKSHIQYTCYLKIGWSDLRLWLFYINLPHLRWYYSVKKFYLEIGSAKLIFNFPSKKIRTTGIYTHINFYLILVIISCDFMLNLAT